MNFREFTKLVESVEKPVILLEGSRRVLENDVELLSEFAIKLAKEFPQAVFRSGGAIGSDDLFSQGIFSTDRKRLELVLPKPQKANQRKLNAVLLDDLPESEEEEICNLTVKATPKYKGMVDFYKKKQKGRAYYKTKYLLRDTLKVCGSETLGASPANVGCFYLNSNKPTGGTGHTIRVCKLLNIPAIKQSEWLGWF